jgi:hypothetical protein
MVRIGYKERKGMATLAGTGGRESKLLLLSSSSIKERVSRMNTTRRALVDKSVVCFERWHKEVE